MMPTLVKFIIILMAAGITFVLGSAAAAASEDVERCMLQAINSGKFDNLTHKRWTRFKRPTISCHHST